MSKLTQKQEGFCLSYISSGNASKAYRENYDCSKMKEATINRNAKALLDNNKIATRLEELNKAAVTEAVMTRQEALERLSVHARVRITDVCDFRNTQVGEDEDGNAVYETVWTMKNAEDIDPEVAKSIKSVTITKSGPKIELHDQSSAIKQLGDMLGWNAPKKIESESKVTHKGELTTDAAEAILRSAGVDPEAV